MFDINNIRNLVKTEKTTAVNIKNNSNRKSVLAALRKLEHAVKHIKIIPPNGIAIFAGADIDIAIFHPPRKIKKFIYKCDKSLLVDEIINLYDKPKELYGLLKVYGESCTIQTINEFYEIKNIDEKKARINKKQKKGGQSQNRIQRLRTETIHNYLKDAAEKTRAAFIINGVPIIKSLMIYGPGQKKEQIIDYLNLNVKCYIFTTDISTSVGLTDLELEYVKHMISAENKTSDDKNIETILKLIELQPDILVFGRDNIDKAQINKELSHIYSNRELPYDNIIQVNHHIMDSFDGCIGVKFF